MLTVIVLTTCGVWCLVSIAVALLIGGAVERRDAEAGRRNDVGVLPPLREAPVAQLRTTPPSTPANF